MQRLLRLSRHALPVLFLAYAAAANLAIFSDGIGRVEGSLLSGGASERLNALYGKAQPHREAAVSLIGAARYLVLGEGRDGVTVGDDGWLFTDEEFAVASPAQVDEAADQVETVARELAERGARLVVVPVPAKVDIYRDEGAPRAGARMAEQYATFRKALDSRGVPVVDTRPALADAPGDAPVFLTRDTHWTPEGAARVARKVAESGLVPEGETDLVRRADRPEEFIGDLVSFVTSDDLAPTLGLGPERVTPYVAERPDAAEGGIFAEDASEPDTVLVGTSYSANENWSFVPALELALNREILNLAEEGLGPVEPMEKFLEGGVLEDTNPRIVLWEYPVRYLGVAPRAADGKET